MSPRGIAYNSRPAAAGLGRRPPLAVPPAGGISLRASISEKSASMRFFLRGAFISSVLSVTFPLLNSFTGVSLQYRSNLFYQKLLNETRLRKPAPPLLASLATPQKNTLCSFLFARLLGLRPQNFWTDGLLYIFQTINLLVHSRNFIG